ncbi:MAG: hypothetical protein AB1649_22235, partial [Chloroflexota bacterium]
IGEMLANSQLTKEFYNHPLIRTFAKKPGERPTYIPPREFVQALFNVVTTAGTENSAIKQTLASIKTDVISKQLSGFWNRWGRGRAEKTLEKLISRTERLMAAAAKPIRDQIKELKEYQKLQRAPGVAAALGNASGTVLDYLGALQALDLQGKEKELLVELIEKIKQLESLAARPILETIKNSNEYQKLARISGFETAIEEIPCKVDEYLKAAGSLKAGWLPELSAEQVAQGITAIGKLNPSLERSMKSMIAGANLYVTETEKNVAAARTSFESWFNGSMENLTGLYKRKSQWISLGIGLFLAATLSVNSIALIHKLWIDPTVRAALVANASEFEMPTPAPTSAPPDADVSDAPAADIASNTETTPATQVQTPADTIRNFELQFEGLELPLGWITFQATDPNFAKFECALFPGWKFWLWLFKVDATNTVIQGVSFKNGVCHRPVGTTVPLTSTEPTYEEALKTDWLGAWLAGILITALATVQGAPFWFDTLNKLINLRGAGARPPTKQENQPQR